MFPDLTRDDVFRLETPRLWLRWPRASDAAAIRRVVERAEVAERTSSIVHPYQQGSAEAFILAARAANAGGEAIELVMSLKTTREPIGQISARRRGDEIELGYVVAPTHWDEGYASEAVAALVDIVFALTFAPRVVARVMVENEASARVLEKQGFLAQGEETVEMPARGGARLCRRYVLDRSSREGLRERRVPAMRQQAAAPAGLHAQGAGALPPPEASRCWM